MELLALSSFARRRNSLVQLVAGYGSSLFSSLAGVGFPVSRVPALCVLVPVSGFLGTFPRGLEATPVSARSPASLASPVRFRWPTVAGARPSCRGSSSPQGVHPGQESACVLARWDLCSGRRELLSVPQHAEFAY